jgi:replicative DNA helicase
MKTTIEAEIAVLGAVLLDESVLATLSGIKPESFSKREHAAVYSAMLALTERSEPIDELTLAVELEKRGQLEDVGRDYILRLSERVPSAANVDTYARAVREEALIRQITKASVDIANEAQGRTLAARELLTKAVQQLSDLTLEQSRQGLTSTELCKAVFKRIEFNKANAGKITGLETGFADLDALTWGLQAGELIVLAARPAMGKTTLAMNIAINAARKKKCVAVFSLEMSAEQLGLRLVASEGRVDLRRLKSGMIADTDYPRLASAVSRISDVSLHVFDKDVISLAQVRAKCHALALQHRPDLVVVDYLQLMEGRRSENRQQEIADISRGLKQLAQKLECPVIALSQLNRDLEKRPNKRPMMADLRESGAIEQDADIIAFLYRDEVYNPDTQDKGLAELIVAKHRNGETGTIQLRFSGSTTRFDNMTI